VTAAASRPPVRVRPVRRSRAERALFGLLVFQGVTATAGGAAMVAGATEVLRMPAEMGLPDEWLALIPFDTWVWPGVILGVGLGGGALVVAYGLARRPTWAWLGWVERATGHHWTWLGSLALGGGLIAWIGIQWALLPGTAWLQWLYLAVGAGIATTALTRPVRAALRLHR
jgi:hypothetical protein